MIYEVTANNTDWIIQPKNLVEEVSQNVLMILLTQKMSVPMFRQFGVEYSAVDMPLTARQAKMTADIVDAVRTFEPRAKVTQVLYDANLDGTFSPRVQFRINNL